MPVIQGGIGGVTRKSTNPVPGRTKVLGWGGPTAAPIEVAPGGLVSGMSARPAAGYDTSVVGTPMHSEMFPLAQMSGGSVAGGGGGGSGVNPLSSLSSVTSQVQELTGGSADVTGRSVEELVQGARNLSKRGPKARRTY